jgi:glutaconate CoA-transferase, subunit B
MSEDSRALESQQATTDELLAAWTASQLANGDRVFVGSNLPVPRAGSLLAHLTHAPDLKISIGLVRTNLLNVPTMEPFKFSTDYRMSRWAEAIVIHNDIFDRPDQVADVFWVGGIQVDQYGNTNLIGVGDDYRRLRFRGPGSLGTVTMAHYAKRYYIYVTRHTQQVLVPRVDFISVFGYGDGGDHRRRLGLDQFNPGPAGLMSPLGIFDFNTPDHRMRLVSLHPGVTVEEVQTATSFEVVINGEVPWTPAVTAAQLSLLRHRIDIEGLLRGASL